MASRRHGRRRWCGCQHTVPAGRLDALVDAVMAAYIGVGKDTVARIWANHEVKPWRVETFKLSNDPLSRRSSSTSSAST